MHPDTLEALVVLAVLRAAGPRLGLQRAWTVVRGLHRVRTNPGDARRIAARIERLGRRFQADGGCYPEALAGAALLAWHGHRPEIVLGVRPGPPFEAHAWVELDGERLVGAGQADRFTPIWRGVP